MVNAVTELSAVPASAFPEEWYEIVPEGHFWLDWRFRAFLGQLGALGISREVPWRGLDVGCGHGMVRRQLEESSAWITDGADLDREGLAQNRTRRGETFVYDIHDRRPEFADRYDFALLFDVLEHIEDRQPFLESVLYHLKPGGWLFLNVPALQSLHSHFDRVMGHVCRYNRRTLRAEARNAGLAVRDLRYWGCAMLPYLVVRKLASRRAAPARHVIERGVLPPAPWMDRWIRGIMRVETAWLRRPLLGTSLLMAAVKPAAKRRG